MKINPIYKSLLSKSINSMLSAIEIYNKPNFLYREETFAILAVNAIELLFKAHLLKLHNYSIKELYVMESVKTKKGEVHKRKKTPKLNRSGNPMTIGIFDVINKIISCFIWRKHEILYLCSDLKYEDQNNLEQ